MMRDMRGVTRALGGVSLALVAACSAGDDGADPGQSSSGSTASTSSSSSGGSSSGGGDAGTSGCTADDQCEGRCTSGTCAAPTTTDGKRSTSLGETDVDCGGPSAPPCTDGRACVVDGDCATKFCGTKKKCVIARSCSGTNGLAGIDTCGTSEPGTESCCKSLPLPTTTTRRLDKYEITAGRVREFIGALATANGGNPDVRAWAKTFAAAHPDSQLGKVATGFPGLLDVLPSNKSPTSPLPLPVHLGAFPLDPINTLDGCFVGPGAFGHATYWQPPEDLKPFGVGYPSNAPDGVRKLSREVLDAKPMNCVMPMMLATFCAWDGGELARTSDYREVWGRQSVTVGTTTVFVPWNDVQAVGQFNWRNGHGDACPVPGWPGCVNPQPYHYAFPAAGVTPADDDAPAIWAPGRFPSDVTKARSASLEGWFDIGGSLMEAAWPNGTGAAWPGGANTGGPNAVKDVCDASASSGGTACTRAATGRSGIRRFTGSLPHVALVGYSFEGHARRSEAYLSSTDGDETKIPAGDLKPITFQYGKVGGRCARP